MPTLRLAWPTNRIPLYWSLLTWYTRNTRCNSLVNFTKTPVEDYEHVLLEAIKYRRWTWISPIGPTKRTRLTPSSQISRASLQTSRSSTASTQAMTIAWYEAPWRSTPSWTLWDSSRDPRSQTRRFSRPKPHTSSCYSPTNLRLYSNICEPRLGVQQPQLRHYWNRIGYRWRRQPTQTWQAIRRDQAAEGEETTTEEGRDIRTEHWVHRDLPGHKTEDGKRNSNYDKEEQLQALATNKGLKSVKHTSHGTTPLGRTLSFYRTYPF